MKSFKGLERRRVVIQQASSRRSRHRCLYQNEVSSRDITVMLI